LGAFARKKHKTINSCRKERRRDAGLAARESVSKKVH